MLVLPPVPVGYSAHYDSFPFSLTLGYDTVTQVVYDLVESIIRNGIKTILLVNGHDGNIAPIEIASRKIKEVYPDARIAALDQWWVTAGQLLPAGTFEVWDGLGHAGLPPLPGLVRAGAGHMQGPERSPIAHVDQVGFLRAHGHRADGRRDKGYRREGQKDVRRPRRLLRQDHAESRPNELEISPVTSHKNICAPYVKTVT